MDSPEGERAVAFTAIRLRIARVVGQGGTAMKKVLISAVATVTLVMGAGAAQAATLYDANVFEPPGVHYGSGNANGHWTINNDAAEFGLRAHERYQPAQTPVGNIYTIGLGKEASFDFSLIWASVLPLENFSSLITIKNVGTGGSASFDPEAIPDNSVIDISDELYSFQNSEFLGFGFLNGGAGIGDIDYDKNTNSTYLITWTGQASSFAPRTVEIVLNQGTGFTSAIPEPSTWALMIIGFGGVGAMLRRKRTLPICA